MAWKFPFNIAYKTTLKNDQPQAKKLLKLRSLLESLDSENQVTDLTLKLSSFSYLIKKKPSKFIYVCAYIFFIYASVFFLAPKIGI